MPQNKHPKKNKKRSKGVFVSYLVFFSFLKHLIKVQKSKTEILLVNHACRLSVRRHFKQD